MKEKICYCIKCKKRTIHNTKFRLLNFPFIFALSCNECGL
jgi:hypothetical protein